MHFPLGVPGEIPSMASPGDIPQWHPSITHPIRITYGASLSHPRMTLPDDIPVVHRPVAFTYGIPHGIPYANARVAFSIPMWRYPMPSPYGITSWHTPMEFPYGIPR